MNLHDGLQALNIPVAPGAEDKIKHYFALLAKWNRVYNLTAIRNADEMVTHHLLDSLAVLPYLKTVKTLADVGSGGGLPGLTLAICRPDLEVVSIEASQKKAAFQQQAKIELGLSNVSIHCGRVEDFVGVFDAGISRAFAELADFVRLAGHLTGRLLAMKGVYPKQELDCLPHNWRLADAFKLTVPGLGAERHLIILEKI
ncbi:MAG: 16S rRNA (guanine(527)-N(7))-methyltransferase RsmG [Gammaproteobacteria bacterium]|nr:16S rRNA (guanine(527)-N(7))-methyltransferase RsmG [Gammaproteobacteria bacterium]MBU1415976.1 16S rRNA (guanine(527)-N(7))-methyltransferase RsmG [Gammaproteobacteria bacterium]